MELVAARSRCRHLAKTLYCSFALPNRRGWPPETLQQTIASFSRDEKTQVLAWLSQRGPFLEQDRQDVENDLFFFETEDVTDLGLGEAARRLTHRSQSAVYSFANGSTRDFRRTPLPVIHGLLEEPYGSLDVPNCWTLEDLLKLSETAVPDPESWREVLTRSRDQFDRLILGDHCLATLQGTPFSPALARRIVALLGILQAIMQEMDENGALSRKGEELRQTYFVGDRALFSDESDTNKAQFKEEMTFVDPCDAEKRLTCFWHGKINTPKFRVHFDWPVSSPRGGMRVPYIGPKISKK
ncbi:hypothetical protein LRP30_32965 [Bradyrhizobium sp. C-145]|uniref:hypothetical protein n=1 Tax=Bradyrhizobium sp. C-145 TaxID=574727 RepID=UPI00201B62F7|nr:hypothetical protein [Bradyrhizobium sp. C-145]UQR61600.1 hypothetical protein LRP30_32965 [Bradyrhizobium sp. C-145]